jgi:glycosyltransferase involved in cell wall biosynthesis
LALTISIAMCTYNGSRYLPEQLDSIAKQNRVPDELVVCDDNSSDDSYDLVEEFSRQVPFSVRLIRNAENVGSTRNFEKAISLCRGTIVALADQDDIWYAHKVKMLEQSFLRSKEIVALFTDAVMVDDACQPLKRPLWSSVRFDSDEQRRFQAGQGWRVLLRHPVVTGATMAFRRDLSGLLLPIPEGTIHDRWLSFLLAVAGPMALVTERVMQYRKHRAQQIGIEPRGLKGRFHQAVQRSETFYTEEIEFLLGLRERLETLRTIFTSAEVVIAEINRKVRHLENRLRLRRGSVTRISEVFREVRNRGYWKYSAGWESVAKDLFIPGR